MSPTIKLAFLLVGVLLMIVVGVSVGPSGSDLGIWLSAARHDDQVDRIILYDIRIPRVLMTIIVGGGLAMMGAAIQGLFRNPLADPALIGVSGGAALFAVGFMTLGVTSPWLTILGVPGFAFIGGLLTTYLVLIIGQRGAGLSGVLLAGIAVNAVTIAGVGLLTYMTSDQQLRSVAFWALGSFNGVTWGNLGVSMVIGCAALLVLREHRCLNAITLGESQARHLGINVRWLQIRIIIYAALAVGVGVSMVGIIAFVGLVVPHLVRMAIGSSHRVVLPGSALMGALLTLLADTLARLMIAPAELPVGLLMSLVGGPFFVWLIVKQQKTLGI